MINDSNLNKKYKMIVSLIQSADGPSLALVVLLHCSPLCLDFCNKSLLLKLLNTSLLPLNY